MLLLIELDKNRCQKCFFFSQISFLVTSVQFRAVVCCQQKKNFFPFLDTGSFFFLSSNIFRLTKKFHCVYMCMRHRFFYSSSSYFFCVYNLFVLQFCNCSLGKAHQYFVIGQQYLSHKQRNKNKRALTFTTYTHAHH